MAARALEGNQMAKFARAEIRKIIGESCTDEMETALIALHHSIVDDVKDQLDAAKADAAKYKAEAEKLPEVQKQLDEIKGGEELAKKKAAYRKLLVDEHINEKRLDAVIRLTDFSGIKLDKDGNLQDVETLKKSIGEDWGEYKVTTQKRGAEVATPPQGDNGGKTMSRAAELAAQYRASKYGVRSEQK